MKNVYAYYKSLKFTPAKLYWFEQFRALVTKHKATH